MNVATGAPGIATLGSAWVRRSLLCGLLVTVCQSCAVNLPFVGPEKDFELQIAGAPGLQDTISEELMEQKKSDTLLNQFSSQQKIDRYQADTIRRLLRAEGYYDHTVTHRRENDTTYYSIEAGPRYLISAVDVDFPPGVPAPSLELLKLRSGKPLRAEDVLAGRNTVVDWIYLNLCLYEVNVEYDAKVFHYNHTATVTYRLQPSEQVKFGETSVSGAESVEETYLNARVPLQAGQCFSRKRVDLARLALLQTNLISNVDATVSEPNDGVVDVDFAVSERRHRTFSAGVGYDMDLGAGISVGWEHRNLLGRAERLEVNTRFNEIGRSIESELTIPHFRRAHQSLVFHADVLREKPDAYETSVGSFGASLTRQLSPELFGSLGINFRYSQVLEDQIENDYHLLSVPFTVDYDKRNSLLNPTKGWRLGIGLEPFTDLRQSDRQFVKSRFSADAYYTLNDWHTQPTFAARVATGTITGVQRRRVPADLRYYVGGGGSVRGYPYQSIGDLTDGKPDGGRSFTEVAFETRLRFGQNWGAVMFLDGGYAYPEEMPSFGENLLWGTGVGLRYLTDFAPIRFDVAVPLDRREAVDDSYQIYISIGQAF